MCCFVLVAGFWLGGLDGLWNEMMFGVGVVLWSLRGGGLMGKGEGVEVGEDSNFGGAGYLET